MNSKDIRRLKRMVAAAYALADRMADCQRAGLVGEWNGTNRSATLREDVKELAGWFERRIAEAESDAAR